MKIHTLNKSFKFLGVLSALSLLVASCDEHERIDNDIHVGYILCSDGQVVSPDYCEQSGKEAVAVVFHVFSPDENSGDGLAVSLKEQRPQAFSDTLGVSQGTSASTEKLDGNANTFSLYSNRNAGSPMAETAFSAWRYGQSAYIPSVAEMRLLFSSRSFVNTLIERFGGDMISSEPDNCWYWTSTEVSGQTTVKAWLYSLGTGTMQETPKTETYPVRLIVTINK